MSSSIDFVYSILSGSIAQLILTILGVGLASYSTYRSFTVSRSFVNRIYRTRALWTGAIGLVIIISIASYSPFVPLAISLWLTVVAAFAVFAWINSTINIALDQDYFHRDILFWKKLRIPFWVGVVVAVFGGEFTNFSLATEILYLVLFGYAATAIIVGGLRSQDRMLKSHLRWIGLMLLVAIATLLPLPSSPASFGYLFLVASYFLYRAVKSLSLTGPMPKELHGSGTV